MAKTELIDSHISVKQCTRAVNALHAYASKKQKEQEETELLASSEQYVWLQITVKRMHPEHKIKPFKIPLKHALIDPRDTPVCLITKDPQREYKDLLESHKIKFISRVVGITKLKGKFKSYEARRMLLKENGMFLADERVIPLLPGLLGKKWFDAKKQPIPVCLTRKDLKGELERAIESTYMHQNRGTCTSVKIGLLSHTPEKILDNIKISLPAIVNNLKGNWDNVQSLHIKTNASISLPIWTCELGGATGGRWDGMVQSKDAPKESKSDGDSDSNDKDMDLEEHVPEVPVSKVKSKGTKKPQNETVEIVEKSVTPKEVKQKRSAEVGEKKKAKIVKSGPAKSAKGALIGKKPGRP
ncbi:ribosomal protein L1p/L10e family-domain-containing protein [Suillus clintonianus]|uniref:ribosomal protein L1p/L10e family-domain-containing protein n=1 Tax=Suillus clintonianus TaxID=1904413 RepID=UPI001B870721|nr:ribosomal protein L1p/L10e family-domain-containing protein [Suillus clintonianus]KAG2131800.1 ribosomal protein L1p/L10e family-domain-containing protein [Suillus clintonianus]